MDSRLEQIRVDDSCIDVVRKDIRNIYLRVYPPTGRVRISAPRRADIDTLRAFALSKLKWIRRAEQRYAAHARERYKKYLDGESHLFLGKHYPLSVITGTARPRVEMKDNGSLALYARDKSTLAQRRALMRQWYRGELKARIPGLIEKWQDTIGAKVRDWGVKQMKTRWGSCNIRARRIWLNLELARKPEYCLEYIVVHEMLHLLERRHNASFKAYLDKFIPAWREYKKELAGQG